MKFLIRDDDLCAYTQVRELENCYQNIWDNIPVNLSVTPFRIPGNGRTVPAQYKGQNRIMPLDENSDLVQFLKKKIERGNINIALHGYHHTKPDNLSEFVAEKYLFQKVKTGKKYLENLLNCQINTFIPPNNGIAKEGIEALIDNHLNLVGMPSLIRTKYRKLNMKNIRKYIYLKKFYLIHKIPYPFPMEIDGHKEIGYFSVTPSQDMDYLLFGFDKCVKLNGIYIFSVHYHAFNRKLKSGENIGDVLKIFIEKASSIPNIEFCTYSQIWGTS